MNGPCPNDPHKTIQEVDDVCMSLRSMIYVKVIGVALSSNIVFYNFITVIRATVGHIFNDTRQINIGTIKVVRMIMIFNEL